MFHPEKKNSISEVYYSSKILDVIGERKVFSIDKFGSPLKHGPIEAYMLLDLYGDYKINFSKQEVRPYVDELELACGGYYNPREENLLTAYECIMGQALLGVVDADKKVIKWIETLRTSDKGFGGSPGADSWINMPFRALRIARVLGTSIDTLGLKEYLDDTIAHVNPFNAFYGTNAYLELGFVPKDYPTIAQRLLSFCTEDGGFSGSPGGLPEMYETERSVGALYNINQMLEKKNISSVNWMNTVHQRVGIWVKNCEYANGGFSWVPGEKPYIQPTFLALHTLWMLGIKPENIDKHVNYILRHQNDDGGFNGGEEDTPSAALYTYYALAGLLILDAFKDNNTPKIDGFLGL